MRLTGLLLAAALLPGLFAADAGLGSQAGQEMPSLIALYKDLHAHPELSLHEQWTSALVAGELRKAGYTVTEHVGKYPDGSRAFGVVALLKNGRGPTVLVRTELDALPVEEKTGLAYASHLRVKNDAGQETGVMHACGHDLHMTSLVGAARLLAAMKDRWRGTLMLIGQPSEELGAGARAMLADGLYERFGMPDYCIALHDEPTIEAGKIGALAGPIAASSTSVRVVMRGVGGHGAHPEATKDPIVMSAQFILALQTIVSREISPLDPSVVTVGAIHSGTKANIIPDEATMQLTVRSFREPDRLAILASIERMARGIALAAGVAEDRAPMVKVYDQVIPVVVNDPKLAARLKEVWVQALGAPNVLDVEPHMGSEDFGNFGLDGRIPVYMFRLGATDHRRMEESLRTGKPLPSLHSSLFYPEPEPALRTGIVATTAAVLDLMKP